MLFLLNDKIKYLLFFLNFAESVCNDKSKLYDYPGTVPFKFYNLGKLIWIKGRFLFHFINFHRHVILKFGLLFCPLQYPLGA